MTDRDSRTITRVALRNYKSIAACDVRLQPLALLVGPNGAGKSSFLDALRFTSQSLRFSLDHALRERGGIGDVRRRSRGHPNHFGIGLELKFRHGRAAYAFEVGARPNGGYRVRRERCRVASADPARAGFFLTEGGEIVDSSVADLPRVVQPDRLHLLPASNHPVFRPVYDVLSGMGFYNLNPERIRDLQSSAPSDVLDGDGANLASVFGALKSRAPASVNRIVRYLSVIVPGTVRVETKTLGPKLTLEFFQKVRGDPNPWRFLANSMSDGTLRALGVLVALFQGADSSSPVARLVGIEEPESALHPAAAGALMDVLQEVSGQVQILATTHSADLLDQETLPVESLVAVLSEAGETKLAPIDSTSRDILSGRLSTAGELLRMQMLDPDPKLASPKRVKLFRNGT
ncbi:MAG: AAA family ATPase [Acidobacteriota bacterium]|nr:AAA family ATPase [Acidobacteriota bacterium]